MRLHVRGWGSVCPRLSVQHHQLFYINAPWFLCCGFGERKDSTMMSGFPACPRGLHDFCALIQLFCFCIRYKYFQCTSRRQGRVKTQFTHICAVTSQHANTRNVEKKRQSQMAWANTGSACQRHGGVAGSGRAQMMTGKRFQEMYIARKASWRWARRAFRQS